MHLPGHGCTCLGQQQQEGDGGYTSGPRFREKILETEQILLTSLKQWKT